eukprot:355015-Chlamydomonas_euryale.AAC.2
MQGQSSNVFAQGWQAGPKGRSMHSQIDGRQFSKERARVKGKRSGPSNCYEYVSAASVLRSRNAGKESSISRQICTRGRILEDYTRAGLRTPSSCQGFHACRDAHSRSSGVGTHIQDPQVWGCIHAISAAGKDTPKWQRPTGHECPNPRYRAQAFGRSICHLRFQMGPSNVLSLSRLCAPHTNALFG